MSALQPRGAYVTVPLRRPGSPHSAEAGDHGIPLELLADGGPIPVASRDVARLLSCSHQASLFAVTLGPELDSVIAGLIADGRLAEATIHDAVGSDGAEQAAQALHDLIAREAAAEGYRLTQRYSPGYGDLDLTFQGPLLNATGAAALGITLTRANMLVPQKTVTAITGWHLAEAAARSTACADCALDCPYRREVSAHEWL